MIHSLQTIGHQFAPRIGSVRDTSVPPGALTVFNAKVPAHLGKSYRMTAKGLEKSTFAHLSEATVERWEFDDVDQLVQLLQRITTQQAISTSVLTHGKNSAELKTKAEAAKCEGTIARTKEHFEFPVRQRGLLILDYDCDNVGLSKDELISAILSTCPAIAEAGLVWWCSGSSMIYSGAQEINGLRGQRLYLMVADLSDTPRAGEALAKRLWLQGHGRIAVSSSGQMLKRTLVDAAMFQVGRLDFVGGAICEPPLKQERGEPVSVGGRAWLDTKVGIPELTADEELQYEALIDAATTDAADEVHVAQQKWREDRLDTAVALLVRQKVEPIAARQRAEKTLNQALKKVLTGDFLIPLAHGCTVSVAEALKNPALWDGEITFDPLEPDYDGGRPVGKLLLAAAPPRLKSFAHGGTTYVLCKQPKRFLVKSGQHAEFVSRIAAELAKEPDVFLRSGQLIQMGPRGLTAINRYALRRLISDRFDLYSLNRAGKEVPQDFDVEDANMLLSTLSWDGYLSLQGVLTLPCMAPSGVPVHLAGYNKDHKVYLHLSDDAGTAQSPSKKPTRSELVNALKIIWKPWSLLAYASAEDRAAMLVAILTALSRPLMNKAPGFLFTAPVQGSGKSIAAQALSALITGGSGSGTIAHNARLDFETELGKIILAQSLAGQSTLLIDNITGVFESSVLAKQITDDCVSGRVLGVSAMHTERLRLFVCLTGNNVQLGDDLVRRFIKIHIDTGVENPHDRSFPFDPVEMAKQMRHQIANAAITLLSAFVEAGMPQLASSTAGFDQWSKMMRNVVLWINQCGLDSEAGIGLMGDPAVSILKTTAAEGGTMSVQRQFVMAAHDRFGQRNFQAKDIHEIVLNANSQSDVASRLIQDALNELLPGRERPTIQKVGIQLRTMLDKIIDGKKLISHGLDRKGARMFEIATTKP